MAEQHQGMVKCKSESVVAFQAAQCDDKLGLYNQGTCVVRCLWAKYVDIVFRACLGTRASGDRSIQSPGNLRAPRAFIADASLAGPGNGAYACWYSNLTEALPPI